MSAAGVEILAFGTTDGELWAAAVGGGSPSLVVGSGEAGAGLAAGVAFAGETLTADGVALRIAPQPVAQAEGATDARAAPGQRLVRVGGTVTLGGGELTVDCPGVIATLAAEAEPGSAVRLVGGWLSDSEAFALLAVRPTPDAPADTELISASLFDPEGWIAVGDPRLSTSYDAGGLPTRVNLELWITQGEEEYPRRAAGEASGPPGAVAGGSPSLQVTPLRCHSRGEEGAGVYLLASF